jgi:transposase
MKCVRNYVGIDISKLSFDVAISKESGYSYFKFPNTSDGFRALLDKISDPDVQVVMEASGPYYLMLATFLFEQGVDLSVVNPLVIRRFCQMRLSRTKTDKKDSKMIAEYGKAEQPAIWRPEPSYVLKLRQMQASIDQLVKSKTAILNQLQAFDQNTAKCKEVIKSMNKVLQCIEKQIVTLEQSMQLLIEQFL